MNNLNMYKQYNIDLVFKVLVCLFQFQQNHIKVFYMQNIITLSTFYLVTHVNTNILSLLLTEYGMETKQWLC